MYTQVSGKYTGTKFGSLVSDNGLSANLFYNGHYAFKVFNRSYKKSEVYGEAYAMAQAEAAGLPTPRIFQLLCEDGHWAIEMEYINGPVMIDRMINAIEEGRMDVLDQEFAALARLQARVHSTSAMGMPRVKDLLANELRSKQALTATQRELLLACLKTLPDGNCVVHGDFQPLNVLYNGDEPMVIDWATAGAGVPACDVARTWLNLSFPPIPILQRPGLELNGRYFRAYQRETGMEFAQIESWLPVMAGLSVGRDPAFTAHMQQFIPQSGLPAHQAL